MAQADFRFEFNNADFEHLMKSFERFGKELEKGIDDYLWRDPVHKVESSIRKRIPVSDRNSDTHAKYSGSLAMVDLYMGFVVRNSRLTSYLRKNRYGYLFFPDQGQGYTQPKAHHFFEYGFKEHENTIHNGIMRQVEKAVAKFGTK